MQYELVYSTDFTQTPLYKTVVAFVGECNGLIPKMKCQGKKLFAGRIRWELGCMTQLLFHAAAVRANKRRHFIFLTQQHFQVVCSLLQCCCDLKFLPIHHYETLNLEIFDDLQFVAFGT